jgi:hypothetical protein
MRIKIQVNGLVLVADLNDSDTAKKIAQNLPITGEVERWGDEIFFEIPVTVELAPDAREIVSAGDMGYWPPGRAWCIFFGPTPVSTDGRPRAASPVNLFGKVRGDSSALKDADEGSTITITKHEDS